MTHAPAPPRLRATTSSLLVAASLALAACAGRATGGDPVRIEPLRGDPAAVQAALDILAPRVEALRDARYVRSRCIREEVVASTGARFVSEGPLSVRRDPATLLYRPNGERTRQILETRDQRLVVDPTRRHATRWTYERNGRALAGVAAIFLDTDALARHFVVRSVDAVADPRPMTRITLDLAPGVELPGVVSVELMFSGDQAVPRTIRTVSPDGGTVDFELLDPTLDPRWKDPAAHFQLEVPREYTLDEEQG